MSRLRLTASNLESRLLLLTLTSTTLRPQQSLPAAFPRYSGDPRLPMDPSTSTLRSTTRRRTDPHFSHNNRSSNPTISLAPGLPPTSSLMASLGYSGTFVVGASQFWNGVMRLDPASAPRILEMYRRVLSEGYEFIVLKARDSDTDFYLRLDWRAAQRHAPRVRHRTATVSSKTQSQNRKTHFLNCLC